MYKMIVMDLDGTLLNSEKKITANTLHALRALREVAKPVLASARGYYRIEEYVKQLGIDTPDFHTIAFNGSVIMRNDGVPLTDNYIPESIMRILAEYAIEHSELEWSYYIANKTVAMRTIEDIDRFIQDNHVYKVVCVGSAEDIETYRKKLPEDIYANTAVTSSEPTRIEFVKKGVQKLGAIEYLMEVYGIDRTEVIAIGDGENDIGMIEFAGCGITMGNAPKKVKEAADIVTGDNDHDGIAQVLEKLF